MIVADGIGFDLPYPGTDRLSVREIERRFGDGGKFSRRNEIVVDGYEPIGFDFQLMIEHNARSRSTQIPVGMIR